MTDEGMDKYGVVTDGEKTKTAQGHEAVPCCPICLAALDAAGLCPTHGSEPFEPGSEPRE